MKHEPAAHIVAILLLIAIALSCAHTPPRTIGTTLEPSDWRYDGPHPYQDDLTVRIALNDTVYLLQDIKDCHRYIDSMRVHWYAHPPKSELYGGFIIPLLSVYITNIGAADFHAPAHGTQIYANRQTADIYWNVGKAGASIPEKSVFALTDFFDPLLPKFAALPAGSSRSIADSVDIYGFYNLKKTQPGTYWVTVTVQNYGWLESTPPVWTGRIQSDTLFFRIID